MKIILFQIKADLGYFRKDAIFIFSKRDVNSQKKKKKKKKKKKLKIKIIYL